MASLPSLHRIPTPLAGLVAGGACGALALLLSDAQALVPGNIVRLAGLGGALLMIGTGVLLDYHRRRAELHSVRRHMELLCQLDYHELNAVDLEDSLPNLAPTNCFASMFRQFQDRLTTFAERLQETEHLRASCEVRARRLASERQQITEILQGLCTPVLAVDQYGELALFNHSAAELLDLHPSAERRVSVQESLRCAPLVELIADTRRRKHPAQRSGEIEIADRHGNKRVYRVTCRSLVMGEPSGSANAEVGAVAVLSDMTDLKVVQKRHAEFVSAVSHEMKTPLAGIKAYVELLADGEADDEETREQFLSVINGQAERLQRLIDNMLNLARIEAGVVNVNKQMLSLNELLEEALRVMQPAAERKALKLESELSHLYLRVLGDRDMLLQVAFNLLSNAIKYTPEGGRVALRSRMEDAQIIFEVEDSGVGLSAEDAPKVFEKFYRVKKDQNMAPGTGLGLPLAKHIIEDVHGGQLTLISELGQGSTFRVVLASCVGGAN